MSMLSAAAIDASGMVGWSVNHFEPSSPDSSPVCDTKMMERAGFSLANFSAISSSTAVPEPSSSAPFMIESRRGGRMLRARAISESIDVLLRDSGPA